MASISHLTRKIPFIACSCLQKHINLHLRKKISPLVGFINREWNNNRCHGIRYLSDDQSSAKSDKEVRVENQTMFDRILYGIGWLGGFYSKKAILTRSAKNVYQCCADDVNFKEYLQLLNMPDTFQSWFLVLQLHVWMCLVRLKQEGASGRITYRALVNVMWIDVEERMKVMGVDDPSRRKKSLKSLVEEFYGLIFAYDEGILSGDRVLASALWRNMVHDKVKTDLPALATLVQHVRKQVQALDEMDSELLLTHGKVTWLPLESKNSLLA